LTPWKPLASQTNETLGDAKRKASSPPSREPKPGAGNGYQLVNQFAKSLAAASDPGGPFACKRLVGSPGSCRAGRQSNEVFGREGGMNDDIQSHISVLRAKAQFLAGTSCIWLLAALPFLTDAACNAHVLLVLLARRRRNWASMACDDS